jgi:hypothetical protein
VNNPQTISDLDFVTIHSNDGGGLTCTSGIQGAGVLSTLNTNATLGQIVAACAITISTGACTAASATCGSQQTPQ